MNRIERYEATRNAKVAPKNPNSKGIDVEVQTMTRLTSQHVGDVILFVAGAELKGWGWTCEAVYEDGTRTPVTLGFVPRKARRS